MTNDTLQWLKSLERRTDKTMFTLMYRLGYLPARYNAPAIRYQVDFIPNGIIIWDLTRYDAMMEEYNANI